MLVGRPQDSLLYYYTGSKWINLLYNIDTTSLSNRINEKLNTSAANISFPTKLQASTQRVPIYSTLNADTKAYYGFGVTVYSNGRIIHFTREDTMHAADPGVGQMVTWTSLTLGKSWVRSVAITDPLNDVRNYGGGNTSDSSWVIFYTKVGATMYNGMFALRTTNYGVNYTVISGIPTNGCTAYSPYGPITTLPSGKLLQTFYGDDGSTSKVWTAESTDGGATWGNVVDVVTGDLSTNHVTEAAMCLTGGSTDNTAQLIMVIRRNNDQKPIQMHSTDGGATWTNDGAPSWAGIKDHSPWVFARGGGFFEYLYVDRVEFTLNIVEGSFSGVTSSTDNYSQPRVIYKSNIVRKGGSTLADFGYPSVIQTGYGFNDNMILFNDISIKQVAPVHAARKVDLLYTSVEGTVHAELKSTIGQSIPHLSFTSIKWDKRWIDNRAMRDATDSTLINIKESGLYSINCDIKINENAGGTYRQLYMYFYDPLDNVEVVLSSHIVKPGVASRGVTFNFSKIIWLSRDQALRFKILQDSGGTLTISQADQMGTLSIHKLL